MLKNLFKKIINYLNFDHGSVAPPKNLSPAEVDQLFNACIGHDLNAFNLVLTRAISGDPVAQNLAARLYFGGQSTSVDYAKANYWWRKSADQGNAESLCSLAISYREGWGVEKNLESALILYRQAAEAGSSFAMHSLADMYRIGEGVSLDATEALRWYERAGLAGEINGLFNAAVCYDNGFGVDVDPVKAFELGMQSAVHGHVDGMCFVAFAYLQGSGVTSDRDLAISWFEKAAERNNLRAIRSLGLLYSNEMVRGSPIIDKAKYWLTKGVQLGDEECAKTLKDLTAWEKEG